MSQTPSDSFYPTGVDESAISLPAQAGSISGMSNEVLTSNNTGAFVYSVPIETPEGVNKLAPRLSLTYNSNGGLSEYGQGWSINIPMIERSSLRGVPKYDQDDLLWGPDGELVSTELDSNFYAPYISKNQNLYSYDDSSKVWTEYLEDGKKRYFGEVSESRIENSKGVYRWYITKETDTYGNEIVYDYQLVGGKPLIDKISYAYKSSTAHYFIEFSYEDRNDILSDYKSGFDVQMIKRVKKISIKSNPNHIIREYNLSYITSATSSLSLLGQIKLKGENGVDTSPEFPPLTFSYEDFSIASGKSQRITFNSGSDIPPSLKKRRVSFIDMNKDALPDLLETSRKGAKVWINLGNGAYDSPYEMPETLTVLGTSYSKLLDVDGDRIVDLVGSGLYPKFYKGGVVDGEHIIFDPSPSEITSIPRYSLNSPHVKTLDLNGDGRLDIIAGEIGNLKSFISTSEGSWDDEKNYSINTASFDLSSPYTFYNDINGDGLIDIVFLKNNVVIYLANLGDGSFSSPLSINFEEANPTILKEAFYNKYNFIDDINGDGLGDIITVFPNSFSYSLNKGNGEFSQTYRLENVHEEELDLKGLHISVADINGNGSLDIVWSNDFGDFRYFDFRNKKTFVLNAIENGLGLKTSITYSASSEFGSHTNSLETKLPVSIQVMTSLKEEIWGELEREEEFSYYGGYFDGIDNEIRGFNYIERRVIGDESSPSVLYQSNFEQGRDLLKNHQRGLPTQEIIRELVYPNPYLAEIYSQKDYTLSSISTFSTLSSRVPKRAYINETIITESDFDPLTSSRSRKEILSYDLDSNGFISKETKTIYKDLSSIERIEEKYFALENVSSNYLSSKVCESSIKNNLSFLVSSERYFYDNNTTHCEVDNGSITKRQVWDGSNYDDRQSFSYKTFGSLATKTDALSHTTTLAYDSLDLFVTSITNGASHVKSATYDSANGKLETYTDENSLTTTYNYGPYLRLIKEIGPNDSSSLPTKELVYVFGDDEDTPSSIFVKQREVSGQSGTLESKKYFDPLGRSLGEVREGPTSEFIYSGGFLYNKKKQVYKEFLPKFVSNLNFPGVDESSGARVIHYDVLNREVKKFNPEHTSSVPSFKEVKFRVGEVESIDELGRSSFDYFDQLGRKIKHKDAYNNEIDYTFDEKNNLLSITDPQGSITLFEYDFENRRTCKLDPNIGLILYQYNDEGLVTVKDNYGYVSGHTDCSIPSGVTPRNIQFEYTDGINRLTKVDYPVSSSTSDIIYSYDQVTSTYPKGKLTGVDFGTGTKKFEYDIYGNLYKTTLSIDSQNYTTEKTFDVLGRVSKVIYPTVSGANSLTARYEFDVSGRIEAIKNDSNSNVFVENVTYNPLDQLESIDFGNGAIGTRSYDETNKSFRLENITTTVPTPFMDILKSPIGSFQSNFVTTIQNIDYEYDLVSNITQRDDIANSFTEDYSFDNLNRLESADLGTSHTRSFVFDSIGNITSKTVDQGTPVVTTYSYNSTRKQTLSSVGGNSYSFDNYGNIASDGSRTYVYDFNNRLSNLTKSSITTNYYYDESNMRVKKVTPSETSYFIDKYTEIRGSSVLRHIFLGSQRVATFDESGVVVYNHEDHLGSSNLKTDSSGAVIKAIEYLPFGDKRTQSGSFDKAKNNYTGQYEDNESDLYYYGQRYYNSNIGRFLSADPLYAEEMDSRGIDTQELNLYAYVRNNPYKYVDPSGNYFEESGMGRSMTFEQTKPLLQIPIWATTTSQRIARQQIYAGREIQAFKNVATGLGILFSGPVLVAGGEALAPFVGSAMLKAGTWTALNPKSTMYISSIANFTLGALTPTYQAPTTTSETMGIATRYIIDNFRFNFESYAGADSFKFYEHSPQPDPYSFGDFNFQSENNGPNNE